MGLNEIALLIGVLGLLTSFAALYYGYKQTLKLHDITDKLHINAGKIYDISNSLSTRYLGEFPSYLDDVAMLLDSAKQSIEIVCDLPGHGMISARRSWLHIEKTIKEKSEQGVKVSLCVMDRIRQRTILEEQAMHAQRQGTLEHLINNTYKFICPKQDCPIDIDTYIEVSLNEHRHIFENIFKNAETSTVNKVLPLYYWLVDGREAIIAIPVYGEEVSEYGFITRDNNLRDAVTAIRQRLV